jgi:hypothetical protein
MAAEKTHDPTLSRTNFSPPHALSRSFFITPGLGQPISFQTLGLTHPCHYTMVEC